MRLKLYLVKIVAGGTPATASAAVGVPTNRKLKNVKCSLILSSNK